MPGDAALVAVAVCLGLLVVALARLVAVLDEAEVVLRCLVTAVRAARRAAGGAVALAGDVGRDAVAGEEALGALDALKSAGASPPAPGRLTDVHGEPVGPVSLVLRPHPVPGPPFRSGGGTDATRSPDRRRPESP